MKCHIHVYYLYIRSKQQHRRHDRAGLRPLRNRTIPGAGKHAEPRRAGMCGSGVLPNGFPRNDSFPVSLHSPPSARLFRQAAGVFTSAGAASPKHRSTSNDAFFTSAVMFYCDGRPSTMPCLCLFFLFTWPGSTCSDAESPPGCLRRVKVATSIKINSNRGKCMLCVPESKYEINTWDCNSK